MKQVLVYSAYLSFLSKLVQRPMRINRIC